MVAKKLNANNKMDKPTKYMIRKFFIDIFLFLIVYLGGFINKVRSPFNRGFFCNDETINYPLITPIFGLLSLYLISLFLPIFGIIIGEFNYAKTSKKKSPFSLFGYNIPPWISMAYSKIAIFVFGYFLNNFLVETAKGTVGRLRPHFLDVCRPNIDCYNPNNTLEFQHKYHLDFNCTNKLVENIWDESRLSFPSGHSSLMIYGMIYFALYLQLRVTWKGSKFLRHLLQGMCLWVAWYTALSRVSDNMHHWSDVVAGMILGSIVALVNAFCMADLFKERRTIKNPKDNVVVEVIRSIESEIEPRI